MKSKGQGEASSEKKVQKDVQQKNQGGGRREITRSAKGGGKVEIKKMEA